MEPKRQFTAEDVFGAFLHEQNNRSSTQWPRFSVKVHRAFYQATEKFRQEMVGYSDWLIRTQPYSQRLEDMFTEFRQGGVIGSDNGKTIIRNMDSLTITDGSLAKVAGYICDRV